MDYLSHCGLFQESLVHLLSDLLVNGVTILDKGESLRDLLSVLLQFVNVDLHEFKSVLPKGFQV